MRFRLNREVYGGDGRRQSKDGSPAKPTLDAASAGTVVQLF